MTDHILKVEKLNKAFGKVVTARNLTFEFRTSELTSIIGPNGAGKSTLINVLTGALPADDGKIIFEGMDISKFPVNKRVRMGLCRSFQVVNVFPELTVFENVQIPVLALTGTARRIFKARAAETKVRDEVMHVLDQVNLTREAERPASMLSHGDQRLLEVGIALAVKPKLLFLDEPTAGMNPVERKSILANIRHLAETGQTTFVIVEHDMDIVFSLSDRVIVLHRGDIICDGPPAMVQNDEKVCECYLGEEVW